jgi:hypothetical protein
MDELGFIIYLGSIGPGPDFGPLHEKKEKKDENFFFSLSCQVQSVMLSVKCLFFEVQCQRPRVNGLVISKQVRVLGVKE